jgi:hypothetical protein
VKRRRGTALGAASKRDRPQDRPERITRAQDGYPESWGFGMFGKQEYERTWYSRSGSAVPKLKHKGRWSPWVANAEHQEARPRFDPPQGEPACEFEQTKEDFFVVFNGRRIATAIMVEINGVRVHWRALMTRFRIAVSSPKCNSAA